MQKGLSKIFQFVDILFSLGFKFKREQTDLLGYFGQPTSLLSGSVASFDEVSSHDEAASLQEVASLQLAGGWP